MAEIRAVLYGKQMRKTNSNVILLWTYWDECDFYHKLV